MRDIRPVASIELGIAICVIFILIGALAGYINITLRIAKETAMRYELANIRISLEHYRMINNSLPENITVLINQDFTYKTAGGVILRKNFLEPFRLDKDGFLLDPFKEKYYYNSKDGRVSSRTKGYEAW